MEYMIVFHETAADIAERENPAKAPAYWGAWNSYVQAIQQAGIVKSGNGLQGPHTATSVRVREGKRQVQDGPLPDAKEHLAGYFVIDVKDLDAALEWAARSPNAKTGRTEIRPILPPPPSP